MVRKRVPAVYEQIGWSPTRIDAANYCRMRYWLKYCDPIKPEPLRLSAYAKGSLLHDLIEKFWDKLGTPEETAKKSSKKKYFDADSFAKYAQGRWKRTIIANKNSEHPIDWHYDGEQWVIANTLPKICRPLFNFFIEEGKPIHTELPFDFVLDGKRFVGRIDEVRKKDGKIIVRDYKSGKPWMGEMKLHHDPQPTIYSVGLGAICYYDEKFADTLGIGLERKTFMGNPFYVPQQFGLEFFMIEALSINPEKVKTMPDVVNYTTRKDEHFFEIIKMINGVQNAVNTGDIYPERGRKCDSCDMKKSCEAKLDCVGKEVMTDKTGQLFFDFAIPLFMKKGEREGPTGEQKKMRFRYKR